MAMFETDQGPVPVWGRVETFTPDRPLLFVVRGAFPQENHLESLIQRLPSADVALVHLPGMHSPYFARSDVGDFAAAFDQIIAALPNRKVTLLGLSLGGLACLAMRSTKVLSAVLVDTPLSTDLWPICAGFQQARTADNSEWLWSIMGIGEGEMAPRHYRGLVDHATTPVTLLVGAHPLGNPRPIERTPSLVSEADLGAYAASPNVRILQAANSGHNIPLHDMALLVTTLHEELGLTEPLTARALRV